jgi:hypothetical protein
MVERMRRLSVPPMAMKKSQQRQLFFVFSLLFLLLPLAIAGDSWLAIEFSVAGPTIQHNGTLYHCIKLTLRPEETLHEFAMDAQVSHPPTYLPDALTTSNCSDAGGVYTRVDRLRTYVNSAAGDGNETCEGSEISGASALPSSDSLASPLGRSIAAWNERFFNMDTAAFRQNAVRFHGRGSEAKHLCVKKAYFDPFVPLCSNE